MNLPRILRLAMAIGLYSWSDVAFGDEPLTYEKAKDRLLKVIDEVPNSEFLTAAFGPDLAPLEDIERNWKKLNGTPILSKNPNLNTFVEIVYRYFGSSSGRRLDLVATGYQAPVYEYTLYEPGNFLPTFKDPKLMEKGLAVRRDYFFALANILADHRELEAHDWGQISVCLTEAFTWLAEGPVIGANSRALALLALKQGNLASLQLKKLNAERKLKLKGTEENISAVLYEQFDKALLNWAFLSSSKNPGLFIDLDLAWLEDTLARLGDAEWLQRMVQNSGGRLEFVRQIKATQSRLRAAIKESAAELEAGSVAVSFFERRNDLIELQEDLQSKMGFTSHASQHFKFSDIDRIIERIMNNPTFAKTKEAQSFF